MASITINGLTPEQLDQIKKIVAQPDEKVTISKSELQKLHQKVAHLESTKFRGLCQQCHKYECMEGIGLCSGCEDYYQSVSGWSD